MIFEDVLVHCHDACKIFLKNIFKSNDSILTDFGPTSSIIRCSEFLKLLIASQIAVVITYIKTNKWHYTQSVPSDSRIFHHSRLPMYDKTQTTCLVRLGLAVPLSNLRNQVYLR
jgi:hypothetical protein